MLWRADVRPDLVRAWRGFKSLAILIPVERRNAIVLKDHNHDLVQQLSEISDSVWRIEEYLKASAGCETCVVLWEKLRADYEAHVALLRDEIARHAREGRFD